MGVKLECTGSDCKRIKKNLYSLKNTEYDEKYLYWDV